MFIVTQIKLGLIIQLLSNCFVKLFCAGLPEQPKRLKPLETCRRPIRVGLSKRAKTKRLHYLHLYK